MGYSKLHFAEGCTGVREHLSLNVKVQAFLLPRTSPAGTGGASGQVQDEARRAARIAPTAHASNLLKILHGGDDRSGQNDHTGPPPRYGFGTTLSKLSQSTLRSSSRQSAGDPGNPPQRWRSLPPRWIIGPPGFRWRGLPPRLNARVPLPELRRITF